MKEADFTILMYWRCGFIAAGLIYPSYFADDDRFALIVRGLSILFNPGQAEVGGAG